MKITFIIYGLGSGGAERAVTGLANYWCHAHEITIITLVKSKPFYELDLKIKLRHCLEGPKQTTNIYSTFSDGIKRTNRLINLLRYEQSEVVISFLMKTNMYALWASKWLHIPCIVSERANHELNKLPKTQEKIRDFSYKFMTHLVVQTHGNKHYYEATIPSQKITVIPNGVSESLQIERSTIEKTKEHIILNVGAFRKAKAQDNLIRAFAQVANKNWRLVFVGDGSNLTNCINLTQQLGLTEHVQFLGAQKNISQYYAKAQIFVFTSRHEGFPNALLEALYFGVPSISSNCPHGPADMITDGENGFLVPVGDVDALAKKMQVLMNSLELREKFRNKALESTKKYEMEYIAAQWMEVIKSVTA